MTDRAAAAAPSTARRVALIAGLALAAIAASGGAARAGAAPVTIYLDRHGGHVAGGVDDAAARVSWIAAGAPGGSVDVPAWSGGDRAWRQVVSCVRAGFGRLAIDVVDEAPAAGEYTRIMVGGTPDLLGYEDSVAGVAPSGDVLRGAVGFVFSAGLDDDAEGTCESALHEIGHTLGLDHTYACRDLMSYEQCGAKTFVEAAVPCGETEARECDHGSRTQSSWGKLVAAVGLRDHDEVDDDEAATDDDEAATDDDEAATDDDEAATDDDEAATDIADPADAIEIVALPARLPGNRWLAIEIEVHAAAGVDDVALAWRNGAGDQAWVCSDPPGDDGVTCERDGDRARFWIPAGVGTRELVALARDARGHVLVSEPRTIELVAPRRHRHR